MRPIIYCDPKVVSRFLSLLSAFVVSSCLSTVLGAVAAMVSYRAMKSNYSSAWTTHAYQYLWIASATYMHGRLPTMLVMLYLLVGIGIFARSLSNFIQISRFGKCFISAKTQSKAVLLCRVMSTLMAHIVVTLAVNAFYMSQVIDGLSTTTA